MQAGFLEAASQDTCFCAVGKGSQRQMGEEWGDFEYMQNRAAFRERYLTSHLRARLEVLGADDVHGDTLPGIQS